MKGAIAAGVIARLVVITIAALRRGSEAFLVPDSETYLTPASTLLARFAFNDRFGDPELGRPPGYPLLLAVGWAFGAPVAFALILNVLLSALIVALVFHIARNVLDERLAVICAWVAALEPTMMTWSMKVMPETLLVVCLLLFTAAALHGRPVAAGIALAAAAYAKPIAWPLVFVVFLAGLIVHRRRALVYLATAVICLAPWHIRNAYRTGYAGFSTIAERAVYLGAGGSVIAQREQRPYDEIRREMMEKNALRSSRGDPARFARIRNEGAAIIAADPLAWLTIHAKGIARTLLDPGAVEYLRFFGLYAEGGRAAMARGGIAAAARAYPLGFWLSVVLAVVLLPLVVLPFAGAARVPRDRRMAFVLFALIAGYLIVISGGIHGYHRFRVPAVPYLLLMSAFARRTLPA